MTLPAATSLAIPDGHMLAQVGIAAFILLYALFYALGYHDAALRYDALLREQVAAAHRDALTGLPTRAVADEWLEAAPARAHR